MQPGAKNGESHGVLWTGGSGGHFFSLCNAVSFGVVLVSLQVLKVLGRLLPEDVLEGKEQIRRLIGGIATVSGLVTCLVA